MLTVAIIEDEPMIRKGLAKKLDRLFPGEITIVAEAGSVKEGINLLQSVTPDLILADVELSDGVSLDIFKESVSFAGDIIFITAHDHYAINAIRLGALDYLLKPVDDQELMRAINAHASKKQNGETRRQIDVATHALKGKNENRIVLRTSNEYHIVYFDNILFCVSDGGYTTFHLKTGNKILVSKPIKDYEAILPKRLFVRTHQSYLVNASYVTRYDKDGFLVLTDTTAKIPVSTRKKEEVIALLFT